jgi:hypothetical protein
MLLIVTPTHLKGVIQIALFFFHRRKLITCDIVNTTMQGEIYCMQTLVGGKISLQN